MQPYIDVEVGSGKTKTQFALSQAVNNNIKYTNGLPLVLETNDALNITAGSPIMYRGVEVGTIKNLELNTLGDRVLIHVLIAPKYQHLVRQNSEFWIASGYDFSLSLIGGATIQYRQRTTTAEKAESLSLRHQALLCRHKRRRISIFLLQVKRPTDAQKWNQGALPAQ